MSVETGVAPPASGEAGALAAPQREMPAGFDHLTATGGRAPAEGEEVVLDGFRTRPGARDVPPPSAQQVAARMRAPTFLDALSPDEQRERVPEGMETFGRTRSPRRTPTGADAGKVAAPAVRQPAGRRHAAEPAPGARLPWEHAARDLPAVLARVRAGETVLLTDGEHVVAHFSPPPAPRRPRAPRPRPVFGALAHLLPEGADLGHLGNPEHDGLPEDDLRLWDGAPPAGGAAIADGDAAAGPTAGPVDAGREAYRAYPVEQYLGAEAAEERAATNAAILQGIEASVGMIPDFPDPDAHVPPPPAPPRPRASRPASLAAQFTAACDRWHLSDADRAALLGVPPATPAQWRAGGPLDAAASLPMALPSPADRAALAVELDAVFRFVPDAEPNVAAFLRRPGTAPDGVGAALDAMLARPAGLAAVRAHMVTLGLRRMLETWRDASGAWDDVADRYPDLYADPIVAEVRAIREALFAQAGYDLEEFGRQIRASAATREAVARGAVPRRPGSEARADD